MMEIERVLQLVEAETGVAAADIRSWRRDAATCAARDLCCWLASRYARGGARRIGAFLGGRTAEAICDARARVEMAIAAKTETAVRADALVRACAAEADRLLRIVRVSASGHQLRIAIPPAAQRRLAIRHLDRFDYDWSAGGRQLEIRPGYQVGAVRPRGGQSVVILVALPRELAGVCSQTFDATIEQRGGGGAVLTVPSEILQQAADEDGDDDYGAIVAPEWPAHVRYEDDPRAIAECRRDTRRAFA